MVVSPILVNNLIINLGQNCILTFLEWHVLRADEMCWHALSAVFFIISTLRRYLRYFHGPYYCHSCKNLSFGVNHSSMILPKKKKEEPKFGVKQQSPSHSISFNEAGHKINKSIKKRKNFVIYLFYLSQFNKHWQLPYP